MSPEAGRRPPGLFNGSVFIGLLSVPQFPDAIGHGHQHGQAANGDARAGSGTRKGQNVGADQHSAETDGASAEKDGGGRRTAACRRLVGRRTCAFPYGNETASGPPILDGEHGQRQSYHQKARSGRHQEHDSDGEDHCTCDRDRDPAKQPNHVLHSYKHATRARSRGGHA